MRVSVVFAWLTVLQRELVWMVVAVRQQYHMTDATASVVLHLGLTALLEFMGRVFPLMSSGFMLTYIADVFNPQFDVLSGIHYWSCQPSRNEQWQERWGWSVETCQRLERGSTKLRDILI